MRIATAQENVTFKTAFNCIGRVAAAMHTTNNIYEIKITNGAHLSDLPQRIINMFMDNGVQKMQNDYCGVNEKRTLHEFTQFCFENKLQPKDYIFHGLLSIKKIVVDEYVYSENHRHFA